MFELLRMYQNIKRHSVVYEMRRDYRNFFICLYHGLTYLIHLRNVFMDNFAGVFRKAEYTFSTSLPRPWSQFLRGSELHIFLCFFVMSIVLVFLSFVCLMCVPVPYLAFVHGRRIWFVWFLSEFWFSMIK